MNKTAWPTLIALTAIAACVSDSDRLAAGLSDAAADGDIAEVDRLIALGAPLDHPSILPGAVLWDREAVIRHLVSRGAPVDGGDPRLAAALWFAAANGNAGLAEVLIELGADVNRLSREGTSALFAAANAPRAEGSRLALAQLLLDHGADVNPANLSVHHAGCVETPLQAAVDNRDIALVELLLRRGADLTATDHGGRTASQCLEEFLTSGTPPLGSQLQGIAALLEEAQARTE